MAKGAGVSIPLMEIAQSVRRVLGWSKDEQHDFWIRTWVKFQEQPLEMRLVLDYNFKVNLAYDRRFCQRAGIDYTEVDKYWDAIRAGIALYCREYYLNEVIEDAKGLG